MTFSNIVFSFSEKTVLVTGSTSGIGAAAADAIANAGASVVFTGRNQQVVL